MIKKRLKAGDLVYAPQCSLLHREGVTTQLGEPTLLLVARQPVLREADDIWCPVVYEGKRWLALKKDLYEPRRKDGDKVC